MPTLDWIGKSKVVNHHLDVPYRVLERKYSYDADGQHAEDNGSENMIIHGDNLEALKSLLPRYEGKIKCIYIDPPYNTGNENWVYNDNVNDPRIKKWLGEVVGKEGEDLSRHDKWLCMMYPRLRLLQKLLSDDGAIFISIDDNELYNLKLICDEIFGSSCFVANISWQRTYSPRNDSKGISNEIEHILAYSRYPNWIPGKLPRTEKMDSVYKNPDNDISSWRNSDAFAPEALTHQGMVYAIQHPITGELIYPYDGAHWPLDQQSMLEEMCNWAEYHLVDIHDDDKRASVCGISVDDIRKDVKAIILAEPLETAKEKALNIYKRGQWPKFFFTKNGYGGIARKTYYDPNKGKVVTNLWNYSDAGHTDEAKKEIKQLFNDKNLFDTPKPSRLINRILQIASDKDSLVLDSFAGSGTTAHAVLNLNKADDGSRKFILIEMEDYADSITAERVKRVIHGYGEGKKAVEGTGGDFSFYELGVPIFNGDKLNEAAGKEEIRKYIWYTETRQDLQPQSETEPYLLGIHYDTAYYFCYEPGKLTSLNYEFLSTVKTRTESYVIYADRCFISDDQLDRWHITFKKIPRDITRV